MRTHNPTKNTLFYPGAFNPPHLGHVDTITRAIEQCRTKFGFEEIWILPSGRREDKEIATDYADRYALGKRFAECVQEKTGIKTELLTVELDANGSKSTHEAIDEVYARAEKDGSTLVQLIGADGFDDLYERIGPELLFEKFIVASRNGYSVSEFSDPRNNVTMIEGSNQGISSTDIREKIAAHDPSFEALVPPAIAEYLKETCLYTV